jgi:DNA polymerase III delta prime subunit
MSNYLWSEEYRPQKIADCVLPDRLKSYFQKMVNTGNLENMTLAGPPGCGKTTVARAMCEEMGIDYILINASENGNIDTIRTTVRQFASSMSLMGGIKCIILDESDYLNAQSAQPALRGAIEEFSSNCRFIFTANFANRLIEPLKSRAPLVEFNFTKEEKRDLVLTFDKRIKQILLDKDIQYDKMELATLVMKNFPDFRKTLNLLQRYSSEGLLKVTGSGGLDDEQFKLLISFLKDKKFSDMRKWVVDNLDNDGAMVRRALYDKAVGILKPASVPQLILFISQYDERESRVVDKEINTVAFLTECMADLEFM